MDNPILKTVLTMVDCGWHVSTVCAVRIDGRWRAEIDVTDNVPDGWTWAEVGGEDYATYTIKGPPEGPLAGVPGVTVHLWINRPSPYRFDLPPESIDAYDQWISEVARVGKAPDYARISDHRIITKPIEWMREPLRAALLRKYKKD